MAGLSCSAVLQLRRGPNRRTEIVMIGLGNSRWLLLGLRPRACCRGQRQW